MRPTYETAQDQANEQAVVGLLCAKWRCTANKTPSYYPVDWSLAQGKEVKSLVEIKFRKASYPTYIISLHKFTEMLMSAFASQLPHLLVVSWPEDGRRVVRYAKVEPSLLERVIHGGRKDRGDSQDMEPMVEIPMDKFKLVGEL